jgi:hypothetical protein
MRETHHLAEVSFDVRSDVLLKRALEALVVRLPDSEELRGAARARDLDEHAVPGLPLPGRLVGEHCVPLRRVKRPQDHGPLVPSQPDQREIRERLVALARRGISARVAMTSDGVRCGLFTSKSPEISSVMERRSSSPYVSA